MPKTTEKTPAQIEAENKERRERFVKNSNAVVGKALNAIARIGSLTGKSYLSEDFQRKAIAAALEGEVTKAMTRLNGAAPATAGFSVPTEAPKAEEAKA